jgi:hypothetical protein
MHDDAFNAYYCKPGEHHIESVWRLLTRHAVVEHITQDKALITACGKAAALIYDYPSQVNCLSPSTHKLSLFDHKITSHGML